LENDEKRKIQQQIYYFKTVLSNLLQQPVRTSNRLKKVKSIFGIFDVRPLFFGIGPLLGNFLIIVAYLSDTFHTGVHPRRVDAHSYTARITTDVHLCGRCDVCRTPVHSDSFAMRSSTYDLAGFGLTFEIMRLSKRGIFVRNG
jgi:hypothetical protein